MTKTTQEDREDYKYRRRFRKQRELAERLDRATRRGTKTYLAVMLIVQKLDKYVENMRYAAGIANAGNI